MDDKAETKREAYVSMSMNGIDNLGVQAALITPNAELRIFGEAKINIIKIINQITVAISLVEKMISISTPNFSNK
jgi:hypothetical protein